MQAISSISALGTMRDPSSGPPAVLIVDDDEQIRNLVRQILCADHECMVAGSFDEALTILKAVRFDVVLCDIKLGSSNGLNLVPHILQHAPESVVIMISGQQAIESAIEAMRVGAFDYIVKPLDLRHVHAAVCRGRRQHKLLQQKRQYEDHLEELVQQRTAELDHLAYYDRLTDLPNRFLFADRCAQAIAIAQREEHLLAVLMVSLNNLKKITDTLGHSAADVVLSEAASRLRHCLSVGHTAARFEGNEFALLLTHLNQVSQATEVATAIRKAFKPPFRLREQDVYLTPSIGISLFPSNGPDGPTILKNAGAALYRARKSGHSYEFYADDMNALARERLSLETSLRRAVESNEFVVYYQPVLNLATDEIVGAEALVRWRHPEYGILPPANFIGMAQDTGLITEIDEFVLRTACAQARSWEDNGYGPLRVSVNIAASHLQREEFLQRIVEILDDTGLDPHQLELELTETSIMENAERSVDLLGQLRSLGVRVAIDDFGTGYSSLSYLKRLPIDTVKLDRSFIDGATTDPNDAALVMAIITLAHNLKLKVVAEGVETEQQKSLLRLLRCDEGQGYLFGKPATANGFDSDCRSMLVAREVSFIKTRTI